MHYLSSEMRYFISEKGLRPNCCSDSVEQQLEEIENRDKIWKGCVDDSICYIDFIPKDCLRHILLYVNIECIVKLCSVRTKYQSLSSEEILWKNKIQKAESEFLLGYMFVDSVKFNIITLFEFLLPIMQGKRLWDYHTDIRRWCTDPDTPESLELAQLAYENDRKQIVKRLLQIYILTPRSRAQFYFHGISVNDICGLRRSPRKTCLVVGSIEDEILLIYFTVLSLHNDKPPDNLISSLIERLELGGIDIWMDRFDNLCRSENREKYVNFHDSWIIKGYEEGRDESFQMFCKQLFILLFRIDEYDLFIKCFMKYKSMRNFNGRIEKMIIQMDYYPFKYIKFIKNLMERRDRVEYPGNLLVCKERWGSIDDFKENWDVKGRN